MTTQTQHTPGPWRIKYSARGNNEIVGGEKYHHICKIDKKRVESSFHAQYANARLIAAAPAMLEALQLATATIERLATNHGPFNSAQGTLDVIRAAVAATQETR